MIRQGLRINVSTMKVRDVPSLQSLQFLVDSSEEKTLTSDRQNSKALTVNEAKTLLSANYHEKSSVPFLARTPLASLEQLMTEKGSDVNATVGLKSPPVVFGSRVSRSLIPLMFPKSESKYIKKLTSNQTKTDYIPHKTSFDSSSRSTSVDHIIKTKRNSVITTIPPISTSMSIFDNSNYKYDAGFVYSLPHIRTECQPFYDSSVEDETDEILLKTPREIRDRIMKKEKKRQARREARRIAKMSNTFEVDSVGSSVNRIPSMKSDHKEITKSFTSLAHRHRSKRNLLALQNEATEVVLGAKKGGGIVGDGDGDGVTEEGKSYESLDHQSVERNDIFSGNRHKYFGLEARLEFGVMFREAKKDMDHYPTDELLPLSRRTPRTLYLREVTKQNLLPLSLFLRKDHTPYDVALGHRGLGDKRAAPIIEVIDMLPGISTINLSDNRLTDKTLMPLARKLPSLTGLTHLDLSFNKVRI